MKLVQVQLCKPCSATKEAELSFRESSVNSHLKTYFDFREWSSFCSVWVGNSGKVVCKTLAKCSLLHKFQKVHHPGETSVEYNRLHYCLSEFQVQISNQSVWVSQS